ncbi:MAG: DUF3990 domain-containing protein [Prevotellaceae bacterium]|jgi:hypothetical protein|nr:DUF3990 domain-containing protein [Prevotellaceae bacterium]
MQVYHGSYTAIDVIDLSKCKANKDFGKGFYVTKFRKQAEEWAEIIGGVYDLKGVVTEFTFYERAFTEESLTTLRFSEYNDEWFDFVILNRNLAFTENRHDYDIIEGPVADDKIQRRIDKFLEGKITRENFFSQIVHFEPSHQICFCTLKSLRMLKKKVENTDIYRMEDIGEPLVEQLMLDFQTDEMKAAEMFYASSVFTQLANISTQLYQKPWQEIYEMLKKELKI